jgi:ATP-dependent Lon protease
MELVQIDGYTSDDKSPSRVTSCCRGSGACGTTAEEVTVTEDALRKIAADYTREPGVRH